MISPKLHYTNCPALSNCKTFVVWHHKVYKKVDESWLLLDKPFRIRAADNKPLHKIRYERQTRVFKLLNYLQHNPINARYITTDASMTNLLNKEIASGSIQVVGQVADKVIAQIKEVLSQYKETTVCSPESRQILSQLVKSLGLK